MNEITLKNEQHFKVREGSNYKVIMTYDREEVINFAHYRKLAKAIFSGNTSFVTVNDVIVQVKDIRMIEPTKELTKDQKIERDKKEAEFKRIQDRKDELATLKSNFDSEFFNKKYGEDGWRAYPPLKGLLGTREGLHVLTTEDRQEVWEAFKNAYPDEALELTNIDY